jgi:23S rRNA G2445 N2-methylase RlmL
MDKREASQIISEHCEAARRELDAAAAVAKEHGIYFEFTMDNARMPYVPPYNKERYEQWEAISNKPWGLRTKEERDFYNELCEEFRYPMGNDGGWWMPSSYDC